MAEDSIVIFEDLLEKLKRISSHLAIEDKLNRITVIEGELQDEKVWSDRLKMQTLNQEKSQLERSVADFQQIKLNVEESKALLEMASEEGDTFLIEQILGNVKSLQNALHSLEIKALFKDKEDYMDCFVEINAGAGGTDSQDWVSIMLRMYMMWANKNSFQAEVIDSQDGEEAGFKQVVIGIKGSLAYGYLKNENGVHRLVRISPFNANGKRQTSFASVFVYPAVNDEIDINIEEKDLKIDTYRSSGAGGQHVNKTESAIRITHLPTNIAVQCQSGRSQIQNRLEAMKILKSRLYELELKKQHDLKDAIENEKSDISWGHQIRNYVMYPYKLVKDARSSYETSQLEAVLDGDIQEMIESVISTPR